MAVRRWNEVGGNLTNLQTFSPSLAGRAIIGLAFDPNNANNLWLSHTTRSSTARPRFLRQNLRADVKGTNFDADVQDYVVLPRSAKDHLSNSLAFGPDGKLYITQGSNSAMVAPDAAWYKRAERLLSGTVLSSIPS